MAGINKMKTKKHFEVLILRVGGGRIKVGRGGRKHMRKKITSHA